MNVLVNGVGNIGTTLLNLLVDYKDLIGISNIYALKKGIVSSWNKSEMEILEKRGVQFCSTTNNGFQSADKILKEVDYIFDCNANGMGLKNKSWYESLPHISGFSTQGSEKGFGIPFMSGINDEQLLNQRFAQIVSCNTHSLSTIINTLTNGNPSEINSGDFVVVRRSEDIGNHQRLVSANVVSRHMDTEIGTHHAIDVKDLFDTKGIELAIQSSDITTPSQLMHTVRFSLEFSEKLNLDRIHESINNNRFVAITSKFDSNVIFELGRRYSRYGRLYSHAIINSTNFLIDEKRNTLKGWAFIPQEGNSLISTIHAFLLQTRHLKKETVLSKIKDDLLIQEW